ncbi:hypothetical protein B0E50_17335 [Rhodanobacter sp. C01]|nr:hypothetical protein B0E50_17335 [Rhodanobacter sp. C01]
MGSAPKVHARDVRKHAENVGARADTLSMQVNNDRLTLAVTKVPQVYLYGVIDAGAPQRFETLMRSGKIPAGSDIYLNSSDGDLGAGMALGRLFRTGSMVTHLGTPRRSHSSAYVVKTAICTGACSYAYLGGLYRWAPTGSDRIGLPAHLVMDPKTDAPGPIRPSPDEVAAYLKDMGINLDGFASASTASRDDVVWLTADQMLSTGLANNGRLPLMAKYQPSPQTPHLVLSQVDRQGEHRITLQCGPGGVTLTAYDLVGAARAEEIVARGTRSYFEINGEETLTQQRDGARVASESVMITRPYPPTQLVKLLFARSVGAWVGGRTSAFRYGFSFALGPVRSTLREYYQACWRAAPWPLQ